MRLLGTYSHGFIKNGSTRIAVATLPLGELGVTCLGVIASRAVVQP